MKNTIRMPPLLVALLMLTTSAYAQDSTATWPQPDTVAFQSGDLVLKGWLWRPPNNKPAPAVLFNHGSEPKGLKYLIRLAPAFLKQGYAFFVPFRRGQGLSQGQGKYILAELDSIEKKDGSDQRIAWMIKLHKTSQLDDQIAALSFLKRQPGIDSDRIIVAGVSFGGIQSILIATLPVGIKGVLDFAGAAMNWEKGPEVPAWLKSEIPLVRVPIFFIQAENDFSIRPSLELAQEMKKEGKPYQLKIYPAYGKDHRDGHAFVTATDIWGPDVFPKMTEWIGQSKK